MSGSEYLRSPGGVSKIAEFVCHPQLNTRFLRPKIKHVEFKAFSFLSDFFFNRLSFVMLSFVLVVYYISGDIPFNIEVPCVRAVSSKKKHPLKVNLFLLSYITIFIYF